MTTVSGLKAMLREEIGAPLDRIRLMSLGGDDLLDLEHDAHDFAAKFAEWGES